MGGIELRTERLSVAGWMRSLLNQPVPVKSGPDSIRNQEDHHSQEMSRNEFRGIRNLNHIEIDERSIWNQIQFRGLPTPRFGTRLGLAHLVIVSTQ